MKPGLILKPDGWYIIENVPEKPEYELSCSMVSLNRMEVEYKQALQKAIDGAIWVQNQEAAKQIASPQKGFMSCCRSSHDCYCIEKGKVYPVEVEYKIKEEFCQYVGESEGYMRKVAILHPKQKK